MLLSARTKCGGHDPFNRKTSEQKAIPAKDEGNLMFYCTGSRENYMGSVGVWKIIMILNLRVGTSKNKNIDHRGKKDCANESDHISFLRYSTMSSALNFCFISILLQPKRKKIWRKINSKNKNIYMWNQYYYFDLPKIGVGRTHTAKK